MKMIQISKKLIKPHTPTPQHLKKYNISFLDQIIGPRSDICVALFYENSSCNKLAFEESLAKILVQFYPLAGRYIKNDNCIGCSDEGVEFVEAQVQDDVVLTDFVAKTTKAEQLKDLLPAGHDYSCPLLSIQATYFPCGGVAIAISVSHLVFDTSSLGTFIAAWSNATNPEGDKTRITPSFELPSLLPSIPSKVDYSNSKQPSMEENDLKITKRFLFNKEAITRLRSKLRPAAAGKTISAVRAVSAVIAKALIGVDRKKHGRSRDFVITQAINMRERTIPVPLPKHACGNFALSSLTRFVAAEEEIGIQQLVDVLGDDVRRSIRHYAEILLPNQDGRDVIKNNLQTLFQQLSKNSDVYAHFTDWSKFGFYEADFGWGEPVWTGFVQSEWVVRTTTVLMSNKEGDGIEAWLLLNQEDMRCFEQDEDIISSSSINTT